MIDDGHRGYLMELLATKLLSVQDEVQIVGMSATLSVRVISPRSRQSLMDREYRIDSQMAQREALYLQV